MARDNDGPWFRTAKNTWYITLNGHSVSLGVRGLANSKEANAAWHRLMADGQSATQSRQQGADSPPSLTVQELVYLFLTDISTRLKPLTIGQYRIDLEQFLTRFKNVPANRVATIEVSRWLHGMKVGDTTKGIRLRSVSACFGWAVKCGFIADNPIKRVPKPRNRSRGQEAVVSPEVHAKLMAKASPAFQRVLAVLHGTGCRPGEACAITATNFDPTNGLIRLEIHKSDRHGKPRLIFVPPDVATLLGRLASEYSTGALLRTHHGNPWTGRSITEYMQKLKRAAGVKAMAYGYRHTFATDALVKGLPDAQVAALLGHSSTTMLHKHYSHLTSQAGVLRSASAMVRPGTLLDPLYSRLDATTQS